jgi:predicted nucleic acid-binding protein
LIVYADSSVLTSAYLPDEGAKHARSMKLLQDPDLAVVTGTWGRIEVAGALVRAAKAGRGDQTMMLNLWDADSSVNGPVTILTAPQQEVEEQAMEIVVAYGIRAMDAWHLACASLLLPELAGDEEAAFASRDKEQAEVAKARGFEIV